MDGAARARHGNAQLAAQIARGKRSVAGGHQLLERALENDFPAVLAGARSATTRSDGERRLAVGGSGNSCVTDCLGPLRDCRIGVWGVTVPTPGMSIYSVRQNLWPLVLNGKRTPETDKWWRWGGTVGHVEYTARSAIGQNAAGDLLYAASMSTTPTDLADALAGRGARIAMELDINPEWVQLDTASAPGAVLSAAIPRQARPASQYLAGWTRDFIAVLAPATGTRTTSQPSG